MQEEKSINWAFAHDSGLILLKVKGVNGDFLKRPRLILKLGKSGLICSKKRANKA